MPRGIGFGSPDACECFRYAPDDGSAEILKNLKTRKLLFLRENGFRKHMLDLIETTNRKDGNDRKDHEKISCVHQNLTLWWYLLVNLMFVMKPAFSFFCTANSFHHQIMFLLEGAEEEGSYFNQKNYHPSSPWCRLINTVNRLNRISTLQLILSATPSRSSSTLPSQCAHRP